MRKALIAIAFFIPLLMCYDGARALRFSAIWRGRIHDSNRPERRDGNPKTQFRIAEVAYEYL